MVDRLNDFLFLSTIHYLLSTRTALSYKSHRHVTPFPLGKLGVQVSPIFEEYLGTLGSKVDLQL
jgi:hypothetical protein